VAGKRREETWRGGTAMAILPAVIEVEGEEATVEAGHLAAKLGLSVDRLRAEMRRGIVYGVVEADGTLNEAPALGR
jgi:hypothetical protein